MRRKQVDSERARPAGSSNELRKELSVAQLIAIGRDTSSCSCFFSYSSLLFFPERCLLYFWWIFAGILWELGKVRSLLCCVFSAWILVLLCVKTCCCFVNFGE